MVFRQPSPWKNGPAAMQPLVLVVDDSPETGRLLAFTLASHGFRTLHAGTRTRALTQAVGQAPDLVLLDVSDASDRVGMATRLREWTAAPILVLLSRTRDSERAAVLDAGANDYLEKPFATADLLARIRVWLRQVARGRGTESHRTRGSKRCVSIAIGERFTWKVAKCTSLRSSASCCSLSRTARARA